MKTAVGTRGICYQATIKAFPKFNCNYVMSFLLLDFHNFYDGIIGLNDLINMNLNISLINLIGPNFQIPFKYSQ